jgi:hypothetical protein
MALNPVTTDTFTAEVLEAGKPVLDEEIGDAIRLTKDGKIVNARLLG